MKVRPKLLVLYLLVLIALLSLFLPMLWEKNIYSNHLFMHHQGENMPEQAIKKMPSFETVVGTFPLSSSPQGWAILFSEFPAAIDAEKTAQDLRMKGYSAYTAVSVRDINTMAVFIGPFIKEEEANTVKDKLESQYHNQEKIIPYQPSDIKEDFTS